MRFTCALIFLAYAFAIIWEGLLSGASNWIPVACLSIAAGMGVLFLREWATLAAVATSIVALAVWIAESGTWPHTGVTYAAMSLFWPVFWVWCPIKVYRVSRRPKTARA
jgi:hypothetical protein